MPVQQTAHTDWVITLEPGASPLVTGDALARAGLAVDQVLEEIGVIIGHGGPALGARLRQVAGVADVAEQAPIHIGPPGSAIS